MTKLVNAFLDVDMRCQHDGLAKIAKKHRVDVWSLSPGEHVVFINRAMDRIKMFSPNGVLSYLRLKSDQRIDLDTLKYIPEAYDGSKDLRVTYSQALRKSLSKRVELH